MQMWSTVSDGLQYYACSESSQCIVIGNNLTYLEVCSNGGDGLQLHVCSQSFTQCSDWIYEFISTETH